MGRVCWGGAEGLLGVCRVFDGKGEMVRVKMKGEYVRFVMKLGCIGEVKWKQEKLEGFSN
jgi:hypothetical protein